MRVISKGGTWKNSEDEILKAAVMKYGKNQWARIASLLVRKSAKQCKTRWLEWLDPSIKKTEWSREEEEKLLHLAKIMPNQWRTIAPIVGRTASQCITHYEKLLDAAQTKEADYDPTDDPRRLRPGEIDPNPESKPARPDTIDMDEDEKEMLSEARARLANTKGKKAKRKAREKQLDEARRLSALQKRRELKAAGIAVPLRRKSNAVGIDYAKEIPFQKNAPTGFFEAEQQSADDPFKQPQRIIENKRKRDYEEDERKNDAKKQKKKENGDLPSSIQQLNDKNEAKSGAPRPKLLLPSPQLSDSELEELARVEGGNDNKLVQDIMGDEGTSATKALLPNFAQTPTPLRPGLGGPAGMRTPLRTPAPSREQTIMKEAKALAALVTSQTPLQGGENPEMPSDFGGIAPKKQDYKTPSMLAVAQNTPARKDNSLATALTPARQSLTSSGGSIGGGATPERGGSTSQHSGASTPNSSQLVSGQNNNSLRSLLSSLPAPQNDYDIVLPDLPDDEKKTEEEPLEPDAADILAEQQKQMDALEEERKRLRSQVMQRDLPRAIRVPSSNLSPESDIVQTLIENEMRSLIIHEAKEYPSQAFLGSLPSRHIHTEFDIQELDHARALVQQELELLQQQQPQAYKLDLAKFLEASDKVESKFMFVPSLKELKHQQQLTQTQKVEALHYSYDQLLNTMKSDFKKVQVLEEKVRVEITPYETKSESILSKIKETFSQWTSSTTEFDSFQSLRQLESNAISNRIEKVRQEVSRLEEKEASLQSRFKSLRETLDSLT